MLVSEMCTPEAIIVQANETVRQVTKLMGNVVLAVCRRLVTDRGLVVEMITVVRLW